MSKISVIVPNYNHARFLTQRLETIFDQTYKEYEVILLDDCSTDNSREIIEQYRNHPKVSKIIYNTQNSGSTFNQWEKGIHEAEGEYIWIAESDDYCDNTFLEKLVSRLEEYPLAGIAYCQSVSVDPGGVQFHNWIEHTSIFRPNIWDMSFYVNGLIALKSFFLYRNVIPNASAAIFRKSVYLSIPDFSIELKVVHDWFFWTKILEKSDLIYISDQLNYFRQHKNNSTFRNTRNFNNISEICQLYHYYKVELNLTLKQTREISYGLTRMWIKQSLDAGLKPCTNNFSRSWKALFRFYPLFPVYFAILPFNLLCDKLLGTSLLRSRYNISIKLLNIRLLE